MVSGEVDVRDGDKNSTLVGASNLLDECHDEPGKHKLSYNNGTTTLSLWEIDTYVMRKKLGRIGSLLVSQCQKYVFYHS